MIKQTALLFFIFLLLPLLVQAQESNKTVREYHLDIAEEHIPIDGKLRKAMTINGQYPGPVLHFTEGELARVHVTNHMQVDSSIHWHGLLVPPEEDGVPYISFFPLKPGQSYTYEFPIIHHGTFWYHSHTDLQEQSGLHGGIVIEPAAGRKHYEYEAVLVLQDWIDEDPRKVLANLKKDGHYYAMKKGSTQSMLGYWQNQAMGNWLDSRWTRMGGMDISDIGYDAFLVNGENTLKLFPDAKAGDEVLLRVINSGTSSYFNLHASPDLPMRIVGADGNPVEPLQRKEILHAVAETYDLVLTLPDNKQYELRASAQDGTGFTRVLIGSGELQAAEDKPRPNLYASHDTHGNEHGDNNKHNKEENKTMEQGHSENKGHSMHNGHGMNVDSESEPEKEWDYSLLQSENISTLPEGNIRDVELRLTGDMESYNWSFNDIPLSRADKIRIKKGEVVRFHFINETMMHHPLHLHGHFFRVLTGNGDYEPIKHTVDVKPMAKISIEFYANEEKDWFFHCHNLYHAKTGMARVVSYHEPGSSEQAKALMHAKMQSDDIKDSDFYFKGHVKLFNDYAEGSLTLSNYLHEFSASVESFAYEFERGELEYQYRWNRWFRPTLIGEADQEEEELKAGFTYTLPLLINLGLFYTDEQETVWEVESEFQLSSRIKSHLEYGSEDEMHYGIEYRFNEQLSAEIAYINAVRYVGGLHYRF